MILRSVDWTGLIMLISFCLRVFQFRLAEGMMFSTCPFRYQTPCEYDVLKTNGPNLLQISTSDLLGIKMKWQTFGVVRSKIKVTRRRSSI